MKLSMWMIANRLSSILDMDTDISLEAKPVLNSARLAYATNCVHVYEEKGTVVCSGEGDSIRIHGMSLVEAFEIIQGVFDYYQDWESRIQEDIQTGNFQSMVDQCDLLFQNPTVLINANYTVLAKSAAYGEDDVDEEWKYLCRYGCSSPQSVRLMRQDVQDNTDRFGYQPYLAADVPGMQFGGFSYHLQFNQVSCGRISVLEKTRQLNPGDYQLLMKLAGYLEPALSINAEGKAPEINAFYNLIHKKSYNEQELKQQMEYLGWSAEDSFQIAVLQRDDFVQAIENRMVLYALQKLMQDALIFIKESQLIILSNHDLSKDTRLMDYFRQVLLKEEFRMGFSLVLSSVRQIPSLYSQAAHALAYAQARLAGEEPVCVFHTCAVYYILDTQYPADRIHACHPVVRRFWGEKKTGESDFYDTLKVYLDQERSLSRTAEKLYLHKNTVLYRLKKITALLNADLDDPASRYYIRLSMQCLEMLETAPKNHNWMNQRAEL